MGRYNDKFTFGVWGETPQLWKTICYRDWFPHWLPKDSWFKDHIHPDLDMFGEGIPKRLYCYQESHLSYVFDYEIRGLRHKEMIRKDWFT